MKFGAMDPFKLMRTDALQKSPSRPAANPAVNSDAFRLPKLHNGPDGDVFVKRTSPNAASTDRVISRQPDKAPEPHFFGGKIVPAAHDERNPLALSKPSLVETLFGRLPRIGSNPSSEAKLNMAKKPMPSGPLAVLSSVVSLGALTSLVAGPAALIAKPGLLNHLVASLPAKLP